MTDRKVVRVADLGAWIVVLFDDGHIERASTTGAPVRFGPLAAWSAPAGGVVHAVSPAVLVHSSGAGHLLGRADGTAWTIPTDTSIVSVAQDRAHGIRTRLFIVEADGALAVVDYDRDTATRGATVADDVAAVATSLGELVAVSADGTIEIWEAARVGDPDAHTATVSLDAPAATADTNGRVTAAVDDDGHLWVWSAGVVDPSPAVVPCDAWLCNVSLSARELFATDTDGTIWSAPFGSLDELAPTDGPTVADGGLCPRASCQWAVDIDSDIWFRGRLPGSPSTSVTSHWWRLGTYGTERFELAWAMVDAGPTPDMFEGVFAAADRLT